MPWGQTSDEEIVAGMKRTKSVERLISERWPKLKERAQNEDDPEKLIPILEEIEDLLLNLEIRFGAEADNGQMHLSACAEADFDAFVREFKKSRNNERSGTMCKDAQNSPDREGAA
jgi:hypothetical protein